ncbi:MAG: fused MFS/spermidine synthase [Deltaproteobacteria bacterium]|nr:fused MFS/spermidine synthase [Deltaproteobacteria bacterium]MBI3079518.1 fused MFS/spermidine synthase [Deltaproteobacteria bacterium]
MARDLQWLDDHTSAHEVHRRRIHAVIVDTRTKYQRVQILECQRIGRCLIVDGKIQSAELDEHIYHELLVHPGLTTHPCPSSVLILGGGEGATLREVLRHRTVRAVTMVDLDEELVALCRKHLGAWHRGAFDDPRATLIFEEARHFLEASAARYDVIINDISDPVDHGRSPLLFTKEFFDLVGHRLTDPGIFVTQALGLKFDSGDHPHAAIHQTLRSVFPVVVSYAEFIPSYDSLWGFIAASRELSPRELGAAELRVRLADRGLDGLRYYDEEAHLRVFSLPKNLRKVIERSGFVIHDDTPLVIK